MGNKKITADLSWNPLRIYRGFKELRQRLKEKNDLEGNFVGEGLIKGGIFVLNPKGEVVYVYEETTGDPLVIDDILAAMESMRAPEAQGVASEL